jgi:large subunit ribosomal protein L4
MAKAKLYGADGAFQQEIDLPADIFETEISEACVYQTVKAYLANQRQGTAKTKGRSEVSGSGTKPWKQKGTGRARAGSKMSPVWVRGGKAHGAVPRDYREKVNKKVRAKALLSALTAKAQTQSVHVMESLAFDAPKTKSFLGIMSKAGLGDSKTLYLASAEDRNLLQSANNVPWATVMRVQDVNTYQVVRADDIVMSKAALAQLTAERSAK